MSSFRSLFSILFRLLSLVPSCASSLTFANVSLDDSDSSIHYNGIWSQSLPTDLSFGGTHKLSTDPSASASILFQNTVAVYYIAPKWPYNVTTSLQLDDLPSETISMIDISRPVSTEGGLETIAFETVWSTDGLDPNVNHTLLVSIPFGGQFIILDGLIATLLLPNSSTASSSTSPSLPPLLPSQPANETPLIISLAVGTPTLVFLLIFAISLHISRTRQHRQAKSTIHNRNPFLMIHSPPTHPFSPSASTRTTSPATIPTNSPTVLLTTPSKPNLPNAPTRLPLGGRSGAGAGENQVQTSGAASAFRTDKLLPPIPEVFTSSKVEEEGEAEPDTNTETTCVERA